MSGPARGAIAVPAFLLYAAVALVVGGTGGVGGVALIAAPFVLYGAATIGSAGPLENTDSGWGAVILIALALPTAVCAGIGIIVRRRAGR